MTRKRNKLFTTREVIGINLLSVATPTVFPPTVEESEYKRIFDMYNK